MAASSAAACSSSRTRQPMHNGRSLRCVRSAAGAAAEARVTVSRCRTATAGPRYSATATSGNSARCRATVTPGRQSCDSKGDTWSYRPPRHFHMPNLPVGSTSPAASSSRTHRCTGLPGDGHLLRLQRFHDRGRHHPARAALHELAHPPPGRDAGHAADRLVDVTQVGGHDRLKLIRGHTRRRDRRRGGPNSGNKVLAALGPPSARYRRRSTAAAAGECGSPNAAPRRTGRGTSAVPPRGGCRTPRGRYPSASATATPARAARCCDRAGALQARARRAVVSGEEVRCRA
jgi:hypothetical protein